MRKTFERPVAIGYRHLTFKLSKDGRVTATVPNSVIWTPTSGDE